MADEIRQTKKSLRSRMLASRRSLTTSERRQKSASMLAALLALPEYRTARCLFAYASMPDEPDLDGLLRQALADGKTVCLPHIVGRGLMQAVKLPAMQSLVTGEFGIRTIGGAEMEPVAPEALDLIIVPGAAFSVAGERLGLGGGYYDRYLAQTRALRIALTFAGQVVPAGRIPMEPHDERVDVLITESGLVRCAAPRPFR